ncbi:MAG: LLM class flavin-dependent oxidoreductase [Dehalococcoidia bacterium]
MKYGFVLPDLDVTTAPPLAALAEMAGWDGVFIPDCLSIEVPGTPAMPASDPWVTLAAMALTTSRVTVGPMVAAVTRRRPWKLAREVATLDILSGGRMVLPVGIGAAGDDAGFRDVGEEMGVRARAGLLDETLTILDGLWRGEPFSFTGEHYKIGSMTQLPVPAQRPRVPLWVVGAWPSKRSIARALAWDGVVLQPAGPPTLEVVRELRDRVSSGRQPGKPFEVVVDATGSRVSPAAWREAGVTWLVTSMWSGHTAESLRAGITAGPRKS